MPQLTHHSVRRMHGRIGITKGNAKKHAKKVLETGIQHKDAIGTLNEWMNHEFLRYRTATNMRYYAGRLYIFCDQLLITVLNAQPEIEKNLSKYVKPEAYKVYKKYRVNKDRKMEAQLKKIEQEEIAHNILESVIRYTLQKEKDITICNVSFLGNYAVRVTYVSDVKYKDWYQHIDIIEFIKEHFYVGVYLTKIKNKDGKYVTRQEWEKLKI